MGSNIYDDAELFIEKLAPWLSEVHLRFARDEIVAGEPLAAIFLASLYAEDVPDEMKLECRTLADDILGDDDTVRFGVMKELTP